MVASGQRPGRRKGRRKAVEVGPAATRGADVPMTADRREPAVPRPAPTVSVVIPAFQAESWVGDAIRSVLQQDRSPVEIIVVDDGSSDRTTDVVRAFAPEVTLLSKANGGEASARNAGLHAATSEWVAFLDADDRFLPGRLRLICERIAADPSLDAVTTDGFIEVADEVAGRCYGPRWRFAEEEQRVEILRRNFIFGHVVARRRRLVELGGFDESISHTTDWQMWIRLVLDGGRIGFVNRPLSTYRAHACSLSADRISMARGGLATLQSAGRLPTLLPLERRVLEAELAHQRTLVEREGLAEALTTGRQVRPPAAAIVRNPDQPARSRVKALIALCAPRTTAALEVRRLGGHVVGTMGRFVPAPDDHLPGGVDLEGPARRARPLVSVVLPFRSGALFPSRAVESVRGQSFEGWELLLVEDRRTGSQGGTGGDLTDERIRILQHPQGRSVGPSDDVRLALSAACAGTIAFCNREDRWDVDWLERQLELLADQPTGAGRGPRRLEERVTPSGTLHRASALRRTLGGRPSDGG